MSPASVVDMAHAYMPTFINQRAKASALDVWGKGAQPVSELYMPEDVAALQGSEYLDLGQRSPSPLLPLVVTSLLQTMYVSGIRRTGVEGDLTAWQDWKRNGFDAKQIPLFRAKLDHGLAYVKALPGKDRFTGERVPIWMPLSARRMAAFYDEPFDEYPKFSIEAERYYIEGTNSSDAERGWQVRVLDEQVEHYLSCKGDGNEVKDWTYISYEQHGLGFCPVHQDDFRTDLDGRTQSYIEPLIPLARRLDQDTFDRLIVQRFGAWKVRFIAGLTRPKNMTQAQYRAELLKLKVGDFLVGESPDMKFGTLEETQLMGFISSYESDLRTLSATAQVPPHHIMGVSAQMQPESLAAAEGSLNRLSVMTKTNSGEMLEKLSRTSAYIRGDLEEARAFDMQVRWKDHEVRSLSQAADALGKLATQVGVPQEMLFEMLPGWTDLDVKRALQLVEEGKADLIMQALAGQLGSSPGTGQLALPL